MTNKKDLWADKYEDVTRRKETLTPSGRTLQIRHYKTGEGSWNYTQGLVYGHDKKLIGSIKRNYSTFNYAIITVKGQELLISGKDYTSQTVLNLETGEIYEGTPPKSSGWCWASYNSTGEYLIVDGCYWGGPYEHKVFDFSKVLETKEWPEITIVNKEHEPICVEDHGDVDDRIEPYIKNNKFHFFQTTRRHNKLGLTEDEIETIDTRNITMKTGLPELVEDYEWDDPELWTTLGKESIFTLEEVDGKQVFMLESASDEWKEHNVQTV